MQHKLYKLIPAALVLLAAIVGITAYKAVKGSGGNGSTGDVDQLRIISVEQAEPIENDAWKVIQHSGDVYSGDANERYRLAGTFFLMADSNSSDRKRLAIIDDIQDDVQHIVSEGKQFQGYEVLRIYKDQLILRKDTEELVLNLSFASPATDAVADVEESTDGADTEDGFEVSDYGKQIGEKRWVLSKESLNEYYRELLEDPERIESIYLSLKADLVEDKVAGFRIEQEGEKGFFAAVGLTDGDVIRKVNSMDMTSQRRGEYFLSEFIQDRLGAVVLDIERNGKKEKLIYFLR